MHEEFTKYFVNGQLRRRPCVQTSPVHPFTFAPMQRQDEPPVLVSEQVEGPVSNQRDREVSHQRRVEIVHEDHEDSENEDFPPNLNGCFSSEGFNRERFEEFARDFLSQEAETRRDEDKQRKQKAKIVSVLAQNLYIMCTLSKDQIKTSHTFGRR